MSSWTGAQMAGVQGPPLRALFRRLLRGMYEQHPDLAQRIPILRASSDMDMQAPANAVDFYERSVWVHKAVRVWKDNLAPLDARVVDADDNPLDGHPVTALLRQPNSEMPATALWEEWAMNMALQGEFGLEVVNSRGTRKAMELWPRPMQNVKVRIADERYRRVAGYRVEDRLDDPYDLPPEEFIHFKFSNPINPWRGIAPLTAVRMSVVIDQLAQSWTRLFFRNQARPDFAIVAPEGMTPTERKELLVQLVQEHGDGAVHQPIVLEQGVTDIKTLSFPPKDLEWVNQRQMSRDEIGAVFGVPDGIMGWGPDSYDTATKMDGDMYALWTLTLSPLVGLRDGTLTHFFRRIGLIQPTERVLTDLSAVPQLQEDRSAKFDQMFRLWGMGYPANGLNEYFGLGLPDIDGGDTGYLPMAVIPTSSSGTLPPAPSANGTSPNGTAALAYRPIVRAAPAYGSDDHATLYKARQARLDKPIKRVQKIAKQQIERQRKDVLRRLEGGKALLAKQVDPADLFDVDAETDDWIDALMDEVKGDIKKLGQAELDALRIDVTFDPDRTPVLNGIKHILDTVASRTNDTTWRDLVGIIQDSEREGEGIAKLQERLNTYFDGRASDYQTERIARTTMTGGANYGSQQALGQAEDELGVDVVKTWIATLDDRTREDHADAHGQSVALDESYDVGGESLDYPGDPSADASQVVNCRCDQTYEVNG